MHSRSFVETETEILHYASAFQALVRIGKSVGGGTEDCSVTGQTLLDRKKYTVAKHGSSLEQLKTTLCLEQEDIDILKRFGDQLGSSDKKDRSGLLINPAIT